MANLASKEFFSVHVQDLRNYLHDSKGKFSYLRNWEVWPYFLPLFWSKIHVCICLSQYTSFFYDCTHFKYLKTIKDSIDFVKGMAYEENLGFFFSFHYKMMPTHCKDLILYNLTKSYFLLKSITI